MRIAILPTLLVTAACMSAQADPPSLGPRAIEGILDEPSYAIAPVPAADDPALAARIAELVGDAERGDRDFREMLPHVTRTVSAAGGLESESWIVAQLELSALDSARSPTTTALGALDEILGAQAIAGTPVETDALFAARERVDALYQGQARSYDALAARLRSR